MIKALIFDLDNTIFDTGKIADEIFSGIYDLMAHYGANLSKESIEIIHDELSRTPFQKVADQFNFSVELKTKGIELLMETAYHKPIKTFKDYDLVRSIRLPKFLVTHGYTKLQQSKIDSAGVRGDFKEVVIVDPSLSSSTKRDAFARLMKKYDYKQDELIAVGDDPGSEIRAAQELGIKTYLYDPESRHKSAGVTWHEQHYQKLVDILEQIHQPL